MIDLKVVQNRAEGEVIPQGISITMNPVMASAYIRIRVGDHIVTTKINLAEECIMWAMGYDGNTAEETEIMKNAIPSR